MLKHVSFTTASADAVIRFYTGLGASVSKDLVTSEGWRRLVLSFEGGGKLQFFEVPPAAAQPTQAAEVRETQPDEHVLPSHPAPASSLLHPSHAWMEHIALYLPDLTAAVAALKAQGVTFARDLTLSPSGNPMAFALDPDGRQVELLQA
ncbi:VOC family protein [Deinococcus sp. KNUC1210]|uniref:VOC family protein n=1 Tax=Deinococcus sp. KNUC1210 TaxID=2917691 RepID=UPI001EF13ED8|nr:VOC family protein [Deinococcus sp. KNUC1210]ULH14630.1 VOC family protein [Deinococcus sp. KNUC1210]